MKKLNVLVMGELPTEGLLARLKEHATVEIVERESALSPDDMVRHLAGKHAIVSEPLDGISPSIMDQCPDLKHVSNRAVGFDNINLSEATARGILVTNTPGVLDNATADLAFALLLACARRICESDRYIRNGQWVGFQSDLMLGPDIYGKTCGIIGMGRIGKAFAKRAQAFGMKIIYSRVSERSAVDDELEESFGATRVSLDELCAQSDFISVHCPLSAATRKLIGEAELNLMKPSAILINTARGAIIDEDALVKHLSARKIWGAGLDVFADEPNVPKELFEMEHVVLTPHIGSACIDTRFRMAELAVEAVISSFSGTRPTHVVNPEAWDAFQKSILVREIKESMQQEATARNE